MMKRRRPRRNAKMRGTRGVHKIPDMKQVYSARDEVDAELAKGFLADAGVEAVVQDGALGGVTGEMVSSAKTLPSLWVRDEDVARAAAALREFRNPPAPQGQPWTCPKCGEKVEPQFTACWNCGTERPPA